MARETLNISSSTSKPNDVTVQELTTTEIVLTATDDNQQPDVENPNLDDISAPSLEEIQPEVVSSQNVDNVHTEKVARSHSEDTVHTEEVVVNDSAIKEADTLMNDNDSNLANVNTNSSVNISDGQSTDVVKSDVELVHATVIIENSPYPTFVNDELQSMIRFLTQKDHLKRNIMHIEYNHQSTREFRNNGFKHVVGLKVMVKTADLWETPRRYLWRNVGQDT